MFIEFQMQKWPTVLRIFEEVQHVFICEEDAERARDFRVTITEEEFDLLNRNWLNESLSNERHEELSGKIFFGSIEVNGNFYDQTEGMWCVGFGFDGGAYVMFDGKDKLHIGFDRLNSPKAIALLQRLSLIFPANMPIIHSAIEITRESIIELGQRRKDVSFEASTVKQYGYLLPFVLDMCALYFEEGIGLFELPDNWNEERLIEKQPVP